MVMLSPDYFIENDPELFGKAVDATESLILFTGDSIAGESTRHEFLISNFYELK